MIAYLTSPDGPWLDAASVHVHVSRQIGQSGRKIATSSSATSIP